MKISVVVPVYNGADTLEACLESIEGSSYDDFEILVVDDCSTDASPEIARRYDRVRLLQLKRRSGAGAARAAGVEHASGEIVAFTDSDCVVPPSFLQFIADHLTADLGGIGGLYKAYRSQNFMGRFATHDLHNFWFRFLSPTPDHLGGGVCAYWRWVLQEVDYRQAVEVFHGMAAAEDTLLGLLVARRHRLRYLPELFVYHQSPDRFPAWFRQQMTRGFSRVIVSRLHFREKVMQARDISVLHVIAQLLSSSAAVVGLGLLPIHFQTGAVIAGGSACVFLLLQTEALKFIHSEEGTWLSVFVSVPLILARNLAWCAGSLKGVAHVLAHPNLGKPQDSEGLS